MPRAGSEPFRKACSLFGDALCALGHFGGGLRGEVGDAHRAQIALAMPAHAELAAFGLALADDQHVRDLLQFRVADLLADRLGPLVDFYTQSFAAQPLCD